MEYSEMLQRLDTLSDLEMMSPADSELADILKELITKLNSRGKRFVPPTLDEVRAYCRKRQNDVDPEKFWNFYDAKDWMVGKNKMKRWQSCIHTWERKNKAPVVQKHQSVTEVMNGQ